MNPEERRVRKCAKKWQEFSTGSLSWPLLTQQTPEFGPGSKCWTAGVPEVRFLCTRVPKAKQLDAGSVTRTYVVQIDSGAHQMALELAPAPWPYPWV